MPLRPPFYVYQNGDASQNHFPSPNLMGDWKDLAVDPRNTEQPRGGPFCMKVTYSAFASQGANWAGIFWQNPPGNWGAKAGGFDLRGYKRLTFRSRGKTGQERIAEFKVGGLTGEFADTARAAIGPLTLPAEWSLYTIPLEGLDLSRIAGGFSLNLTAQDNPKGCVFYLNDIRYEI